MLIKTKKSAIIVQGVVNPSLFDYLKKKKKSPIVVLEGRPKLIALKQSCHELIKRKLKPVVITDNSAGFLFYKNLVKEVWIAFHMIDQQKALCDIGALIIGVLARAHKIPVYLYPAIKHFQLIGNENDTLLFQQVRIAPDGVKAFVPLMEWLPLKYTTKIYETK